jgi:superfamily I DNA and RNA helicase
MGYELKNIVVLYGKGREKSHIAKLTKIGPFSLKQFTGEYTENGENIYTEGNLLVESIYRFKGLQKAVVIFAELDFEKWNKHLERVIYTGCTRARLELSVLMSKEAERALMEKIRAR